jgi:hypothetical protein
MQCTPQTVRAPRCSRSQLSLPTALPHMHHVSPLMARWQDSQRVIGINVLMPVSHGCKLSQGDGSEGTDAACSPSERVQYVQVARRRGVMDVRNIQDKNHVDAVLTLKVDKKKLPVLEIHSTLQSDLPVISTPSSLTTVAGNSPCGSVSNQYPST